MITKLKFVLECKQLLISSLPKSGALSSIHEMEEMKLNKLKESESVPQRLADDCVSILFARVQLFRGYDSAGKFLQKIDDWRDKNAGN